MTNYELDGFLLADGTAGSRNCLNIRHCEELATKLRSHFALMRRGFQTVSAERVWIDSLRSQ